MGESLGAGAFVVGAPDTVALGGGGSAAKRREGSAFGSLQLLLHEGDLLTFLRDLRDSGNAYYSVKRCNIARNPGLEGTEFRFTLPAPRGQSSGAGEASQSLAA